MDWILVSIHWTWTRNSQIKYMYNLNESVNRVCLHFIGVSKMHDGKVPGKFLCSCHTSTFVNHPR